MGRDPIEGLVEFVFGAAAIVGGLVFWIWMIKAIRELA